MKVSNFFFLILSVSLVINGREQYESQYDQLMDRLVRGKSFGSWAGKRSWLSNLIPKMPILPKIQENLEPLVPKYSNDFLVEKIVIDFQNRIQENVESMKAQIEQRIDDIQKNRNDFRVEEVAATFKENLNPILPFINEALENIHNEENFRQIAEELGNFLPTKNDE